MVRAWRTSCAREGCTARRRRSRSAIALEWLERRELLAVDISAIGEVEGNPVGDADGVWQSEAIQYTIMLVDRGSNDGPTGLVVSDVLDPRVEYSGVDVSSIANAHNYTVSYDAPSHVVTVTFPDYSGSANVMIRASAQPSASGAPGPQLANHFSITTSDENTDPRTSGDLPFNDPGPIADVELTSVTASSPDGFPIHRGGEVDYAFVVTNNSTTTTAPTAVLSLHFDSPVDLQGMNPSWTTNPSEGVKVIVGPEYFYYKFGDLAPGESRTVSLVVPAPQTTPRTAITFQAVAAAYTYDLVPSNNVANVSTPLAASAYVQVAVAAETSASPVGSNLTYHVTFKDPGPNAATGLSTTQTLPAGTTFVSALWNGQPIAGSVAAGVLSIALPDLSGGAAGTLAVTLNIAGAAASAPTTLSAEIDADWSEIPRTNHGVYTLGTVIPAGSLAIGLTATQTAVDVNGSLTYSYTVTNPRATDAHDVDVALAFPPASLVAFAPGPYSVDQSPTEQVVRFHASSLAAGASVTFSVQATALGPTVGGTPVVGVLPVVGTITEADRPTSDYVALTLYTSVLPGADVSIQQIPSEYGSIAILVTNNRPFAATNVKLAFDDTLTVRNAYRDGSQVPVVGVTVPPPYSPPFGHFPPQTEPPYTIFVGDLAAGQSVVIKAIVEIPQSNQISGQFGDVRASSDLDPGGFLLSLVGGPYYQRGIPYNGPPDTVSQLTTDVSSVATGGYATFTALATNVASFDGRGVMLAATIPANSRLVATSPGVVVQGNLLLFTVDDLPVGATGGFQYVVSPTWDAQTGGLSSYMGVYQTAWPIVDPATAGASATIAVTPGPSGELVLDAPSYNVNEDAGTVAVVVDRVGGVSGPVSLSYTTAPVNAVPGVDYMPVSGTLDFADGETSKTILVPILSSPLQTGDRSFWVNVSTGQSALVTIHDVSPPVAPPSVASVSWSGPLITVQFNTAMTWSTTLNRANYVLVDTAHGRRIAVTPRYNPATATTTLRPSLALPAGRSYRLTVRGSLLGADGVALAGDGVHPGTDYTVTLQRPGRRPPSPRPFSAWAVARR